jgi:hypothetical protein
MNSTHHSALPASGPIAAAPNALKGIVTEKLAHAFRRTLPQALVRRAVDEAEAVALTTGFPHLFLPLLAEEKVRSIHAAVAEPAPAFRSRDMVAAA